MGKIVELLEQVTVARGRLARAKSFIPSEIAQAIAAAEEEVKAAEAAVKAAARFIPPQNQHTLVGASLQLVWTNGRITWDTPALEELAREFPRILEAKAVGDGYWSIKTRGKGK